MKTIAKVKCGIRGHVGLQSQENPDGTWTPPRCPRCDYVVPDKVAQESVRLQK